MSARRSARRPAALAAVLASSVACQGILGIEEGRPRADTDAGASGGSSSGSGGSATGGSAAGGDTGAAGGAGGAEAGAGGERSDGGSTGGASAGGADAGVDAEAGSGGGLVEAGTDGATEGGTEAGADSGDGATDGAVVTINEVESNGGSPGDWVELHNSGGTAANVTGYVLSDSNDGSRYALPPGSVVAPGGYLVLEEADFAFGLGSADTARLLAPDGTTLVDLYTWTSHAFTTYGACPDGVGELVTTAAPTKGAANDCAPDVVLSEVESNGGLPGDWIELHNTGLAPADVSGWILRDDDDTHEFDIPAGTVIAPGRFVAFDESALGFALGSADSVRLYFPGGTTLIDRHDWTAHAATTYGRCPAAGPFVTTVSSTKAAPNDCGSSADVDVWPGTNATTAVDVLDALGDNLSGLSYEPGAAPADDVLWAVRNGPSVLYRLKHDGTAWIPDTVDGWSAGKQLLYPNGLGDPDAESVTRAAFADPDVYVAAERDNDDNQASRFSVLRFSTTDTGTSLVAADEWNLTADLPASDPNRGLEGVTWIPDVTLTSKGFHDERLGKAYDPADYPGHGAGLFVVGFEATGGLYVYALSSGGTSQRVAAIASGNTNLNGLELDRDVGYLWTYCGVSCANVATVLDIDTGAASPTRGRFVVRARYQSPSTLTTLANEGITFVPESRCVSGEKAFFWADDDATNGRGLRRDTIPCGAFLP